MLIIEHIVYTQASLVTNYAQNLYVDTSDFITL